MQLDLDIKQELEKNIFDTNLFDIKILDNEYYFDFSACKKSSNFPEDNFTNFFKNRKELYKFVKKEYFRFLNNDFDGSDGLLEDYQIKNFGGRRKKVLRKIIRDNNAKRIESLPIVYRLCHSVNKELQFYYYETSSNVYRVVAIDLFHLLFPANDNERPNIKNDGIDRYNENKDNQVCLSEILNIPLNQENN